MSKRKTKNTKQIVTARAPLPPHPPPKLFNFEILLEYFKYLYFIFYLNILLIKVSLLFII
jgi:hypothetical protein